MSFKAVKKEHPTPSSPTHPHFPSKGSLWGVKVQERGHSPRKGTACTTRSSAATNRNMGQTSKTPTSRKAARCIGGTGQVKKTGVEESALFLDHELTRLTEDEGKCYEPKNTVVVLEHMLRMPWPQV